MEEDLQRSYNLRFNEYKNDLKYLGIEIEKFNENILLNWFNQHLRNLENTKNI